MLLAIIGDIYQFLGSILGRGRDFPSMPATSTIMMYLKLLIKFLGSPHLKAQDFHFIGRNEVALMIHLVKSIAMPILMLHETEFWANDKHISYPHLVAITKSPKYLVFDSLHGCNKL